MKRILIVILILFAIHFWRYVMIPQNVLNITNVISLLIFGVAFVRNINNTQLNFRNAIILFLIGLVLNIISAYINNQQGIKDTALSMGHFYFILFYFILHELKAGRKELEQIIIVFAILYSVFHLIQDSVFPQLLFIENIYYDRGTVRMRLEGDGFLMLAYFLLLNRFLLKRNFIDLFLALFFFFILFLSGFRTLSVGALLLSGFIFLKRVKYSPMNYILVVLAVVLFAGVLQMDRTSRIINEMLNVSEQQKDEGDSYIRKRQFRYFTEEYPENASYYVFGGGYPGSKGAYANKMLIMTGRMGFYWVDLGLLGFWLVMGLITSIGLLWYSFKAMFIRLPKESLYLNVYFVFLFLVTNITLNQMYRVGIFGVQAIALYLIDIERIRYLLRKKEQIDAAADS